MSKFINVLGLMSGTSMDGIDLSIVRSNGTNIEKYFFSKTYPYMEKTIAKINNTFNEPQICFKDKKHIQILSDLITNDHIKAIKQAIQETGITPDLIGFHGQTIFHEPQKKKSIQLGNGKKISDTFGINVVYNFRNQDIKNGGQGAPLIPIYHQYLTKREKLPLPTCFLNIGGVANISYINNKQIIGFDTGPGNGLMDTFIKMKTKYNFDFNGNYAKSGYVNHNVVNAVLKDSYFKLNFPKSLDKLYFDYIFSLTNFKKLNFHDALATLSKITESSIIQAISLLPKKPVNLIIHGGGAFNLNLIKNLKENLDHKILLANEVGLSTEFLESELIAYLAVRRIYNLPITFPSTTGVNQPTIGGDFIRA